MNAPITAMTGRILVGTAMIQAMAREPTTVVVPDG